MPDDAQRGGSATCPWCQSALTGSPSCPTCGLVLVGAAAQQLWEVDQQLASLSARRWELLTSLRASSAAPHARTWQAPLAPPRPPAGVQGALLALGAGVLLVAAVVFVAVAWRLLGVAGQLGLMLALTAAAAAGTRASVARGLRGTGEALGALVVGLLTITAGASWSLGLAEGWGLSGAGYTFLAAVVVSASSWLLWRAARTETLALGWAGASALALLAGSLALEPSQALGQWCAVGSCAVLAALARFCRPGSSATLARVALVAAALAAGLVALLLGASLAGESGLLQPTSGVLGLAVLVVATGGGWLRAREAQRAWWAVGGLTASTTLGLSVAARAQGGRGFATAGALACVCALVALGIEARAPGAVAPRALRSLGMVLTTASVFFTAAAAARGPIAVASAAAAVTWLAAAGGSRAPSPWRASAVRPVLLGTAAAFALLGLVCAGPVQVRVGPLVLAGGALLVLAAAARSRDGASEAVLGLVVTGAFCGATLWAAGADVPTFLTAAEPSGGASLPMVGTVPVVSIVLAAAAAGGLAYSLRAGRGAVATLGVAAAAAAMWTALAEADVGAVEAYSLPVAALLLGIGVARLRRQPTASSWETLGPAWATGLLPSAVWSATDSGLLRAAVVLTSGALLVLVGLNRHSQAEFVTGAVGVAVAALGQLGPWAATLPRWLVLGVVGGTLLWAGAGYERRRAAVLAAGRRVSAMR